MSKDTQTFDAIDIDIKYKKLIYGGVLFAFLGLAIIIGGYFYFLSQGAYAKDAPQSIMPLVPFTMIFLFLYGVNIYKRGRLHRKLFEQSDVRGLRLDSKGVRVSVLLLEGVYGEALVEQKSADFAFDWDDVHQFIVEPRRGGEKNGSPPYYKITYVGRGEDMNSSCYILREPFKKNDAQIVKYVRKKIGDERLILNDEIYA